MPAPRSKQDTTKRRLEERSAGAVVFTRVTGPVRYLLLKYPAGHWDLPKGNIEAGEQPAETMVREVREETGLTGIRTLPGFEHKIEYYYMRSGKKVHKTVVFFLAEAPTDKVEISFEHQDYRWLEFAEAMDAVTYPNARRLMREADAMLKGLR